MQQIFTYGTLLYEDIQLKLLGRICQQTPDTLQGYSIRSISQEGKLYPLAYEKKGAILVGAVIAVSIDEMAILDQYEGEDYERKQVKLMSDRIAWIYC